MNTSAKNVIPFVLGAALIGGCAVDDADLSTAPALTGLTVTASDTRLAERLTQVTGQLTLGYTADLMVDIAIYDGATQVHASSVPADSLTIAIDAAVELVEPGGNELTVEASYNGQSIQTKLLVTVPGALQSFSLSPAATAVNVFESTITGQVEFGHVSDRPAMLDILVGGASVYQQSFDVLTPDGLSQPIAAVIQLEREGSNEVVGVLRYENEELGQAFTVDVAMDAPTLTFPTWAETYVMLEGLTVSGDLSVSADPAYAVAEVALSVDSGPWLPTEDLGGGQYHAEILDPDIGVSDLAVRVTVLADGHPKVTEFHDTLSVAARFDCNTPSQSMLPDTDLIENLDDETRTMVGYFGRADGGHDISFVIDTLVPDDGPYTVVGQARSHGPALMSVEYRVNRLRCNNAPCSLDYDLTLYVDGQAHCSRNNFGRILRY